MKYEKEFREEILKTNHHFISKCLRLRDMNGQKPLLA